MDRIPSSRYDTGAKSAAGFSRRWGGRQFKKATMPLRVSVVETSGNAEGRYRLGLKTDRRISLQEFLVLRP